MKNRLINFLNVLSALLTVSVSAMAEDHAAPVTHRVTASNHSWLWHGQRSGSGESEALRVYAKPGDLIEFRQSDGIHGVLFYRSKIAKNNRTELGRLVVVDRDFEVVGDSKLQELAAFKQRNLSTSVAKGARSMVMVRLKPTFDEPIFFACPRDSLGYRHRMYGVILPERWKPSDSVQSIARKYKAIQRPGRVEVRTIQNVDPDPSAQLQIVQSRILLKLGAADSLRDVTTQWMHDQEYSELAAPSPDTRWYYADSYQLDQDRDADVIALIGTEDVIQWYVLRNSSATKMGSLESHRGFLPPIILAESKVSSVQAEHALCGVTDVNNDGIEDIVVYLGADSSNLPVYIGVPELARDPVSNRVSKRVRDYRLGPTLNVLDPDTSERVVAITHEDVNSDGWEDLILVSSRPGIGGRGTLTVALNSSKDGFSQSQVSNRELAFIPAEISTSVGIDGLVEIALRTSVISSVITLDGAGRIPSGSQDN